MDDIVDASLSEAEIRALGDIAGTMVPASADYGVPGADDPAILADIVKSLGRDLPQVREAVAAIGAKAGGGFAGMDTDSREALLTEYVASSGGAGATLARVVLSAYYRDDRVLVALGMEPRAPFPKGHVLEQGDWSLLDPVRGRAPFWRDDRPQSHAEERPQGASRSMGNEHRADGPPFETRPAGAPQGEVE